MNVAWGHYVVPYVYADSLGPGGQTHPRLASTIGGRSVFGQPWSKQLGALGDDPPPGGVEDCPPGWPAGVPCMLPPQGPGGVSIPILTEEEAVRREVAAYERGKADEARSVVKTAAISAAVSAIVGIAIGKFVGG